MSHHYAISTTKNGCFNLIWKMYALIHQHTNEAIVQEVEV